MASIMHPERFQGERRRRSWFEGWYFKHVSASGEAWSFIPGVARDAAGRGEAFVQTIDGSTGDTRWFPYPLEAFSSPRDRFEVRVGESRFSLEGASVRLGEGDGRIEADLRYGTPARFPSTLLWPGIMGPFAWVPFMECSHGLVSLDHEVDGWVRAGGRTVSMDGGRGYIEKDWGRSMPSSWIWSQSNAFPERGDSFMLSVARIPWMGSSFVGFLCVLRAGGRLLRFATYTGHRLVRVETGDRRAAVEVAGRGQVLRFTGERGRAGNLAAPVLGSMNRRIAEAVDATVHVEFEEGGRLSWQGTAQPAGLEVVGDISELDISQARSGGMRRKETT